MFNRFNKRNLKCGVCGRTFNEHAADHICAECWEIAGIDNMINDSGGSEWSADVAVQLGRYLAAIAKKGGDIAAVKASNDYIDWSLVPTIASRAVKTGGDTSATNGVKAPVVVNGKAYRSVLQAFQQLGLPVSKHQKFRKELKTKGSLVFEDAGHLYMFTAAGF